MLVTLVVAACSGGGSPPEIVPGGPPEVRLDVVARHAEQFEDALADRAAGSQGEEAASIYLLGHLQRAGYVVLLEPVPVADLVRSTNLVGQAPSGQPPVAVVAVPYDAPAGPEAEGSALGLWLELARALRVAEPRHSVEFVALGAEYATTGGGHLGSRRLAKKLLDSDESPTVVELRGVSEGAGFSAVGPVKPALLEAAGDAGVAPAPGADPPDAGGAGDVWRKAELPYVLVGGDPGEVGAALLRYLEGSGR